MTEPKYCIQRRDGQWYVGTVDKNPVWRDEPSPSGAFNDSETAVVRATALAEGEAGLYKIEKVFL